MSTAGAGTENEAQPRNSGFFFLLNKNSGWFSKLFFSCQAKQARPIKFMYKAFIKIKKKKKKEFMYKAVIHDVCPIVPTIGLHSNQASEDIQLIVEI